jgi:hypothetical protein
MNKEEKLLAALRAAQQVDGAPLTVSQVEAIGAALGLLPEALPELLAGLQRQGLVEIPWNSGIVRVLPQRFETPFSQVIHAGPGAVVQAAFHGSATMGSVTIDSAAATGVLVKALGILREAKSTFPDETKHAVDAAETALAKATAANTSSEEKRGYVSQAASLLKGLLAISPQIKNLADAAHTIAGLTS